MDNQLKDSLVQAMKIMTSEDSKKTYECTVLKCLDGVTGEYELEYLSNKIKAFSLSASKKYSPKDLVIVIAPKGDINDVKYILGTVNPSPFQNNGGGGGGGGQDPDPDKPDNPDPQEDIFVPLTDDLFDKDNPDKDIFGLKSYYSKDYVKGDPYFEENITLKVCDIPRFKERIVKYVNGKETTYLRLKANFKTSLSQEQIFSSGYYGVKLAIPFLNKGYVEYDFNSNQMEGNPKSFTDWTLQTYDIKINQGLAYNEALPPILKIYKNDFILNESKVKEPDIQIRSIELYALSILTPDDLKGYKVFITATGGDYFIKSDSVNKSKTLTASLKSNGIETDTSRDEIYWFIEDSTIDEKDPEFFDISGKGWKCLNPYTIETIRTEEGPVEKVKFNPRLEEIKIIAKDISGQRKFKCLIKHNGAFFSGETTIYNETDTYSLEIISNQGNIISLYEDEVELKLKFYYKGLTENLDNVKKICYTWSKVEKDGSEDFYFTRKYLQIIEKNQLLVEKNKGYWVTYVKFPASIIDKEATIRCNVDLEGPIPTVEDFQKEKKYFVGSAELKLELSGEFTDPYLEDVKKRIPSVLYSYNTTPLIVQQKGTVIASIACKILKKTNLQGHLVVNLISSEYCNAIIKFLDNEMVELFAPVTYTLQPGRNTIGIPHDYLYRLAGIHSFIITMQCTNGTVTIPTRGVMFTITGGYLLERLLDIGMDIQDISVRQSIGNDLGESFIPFDPEELWAIGIDNEEILVKSCKYDLDNVLEWKPRYKMGKGTLAAIEFDGKWVLREDEQVYTLITEKEPFIFIVEGDGRLFVYKGEDPKTKTFLAEKVTKLSVIRGYKSEKYPDQDQGLICAYISKGLPCYRQYAYDSALKKYHWIGEVGIAAETANDIYVQRLNDYRVGFLVEYSNRNMWYLTSRIYTAQAVPKEKIYYNTNFKGTHFAVIPYIEGKSALAPTPFVVGDPFAEYSYFYTEFSLPLMAIGYSIDDYNALGKNSLVTINGEKRDDYKVVVRDNKIGILFDPPLKATPENDFLIKWKYTFPDFLYLKSDENHYAKPRFRDDNLYWVKLDLEYSWALKRPVYEGELPVSENIDINIEGEMKTGFKTEKGAMRHNKEGINMDILASIDYTPATVNDYVLEFSPHQSDLTLTGTIESVVIGTTPI